MYQASNAFHTAVAEDKPQIAMLLFEDAVFTNNDIRVDNGLDFTEYFNTEEDLAIGQTPSSELTFTLFNDGGVLENYVFGEFLATIGVQINETTWTPEGGICAASNSNTWAYDTVTGVLKRNRIAVSNQPQKAILCIMILDTTVYCFGDDYVICYNDTNGNKINKTVNAFMYRKAKKLEGLGAYYRSSTRLLKLYEGTDIQTYEFVPLGWFTADRPNVPTTIEIDFTCYDRMQKFDIDMPDASALGISYPTTIGTLYAKMCNYVGVTYQTSSFLNSGAEISEEPDAFSTATMRTVLGWIAEAAASNARFDRDGVLIMDWMRSTNQTIDETGYSEFNPYWYATGKVGKLYNRDTESGEDITITAGSGSESYLIQDNPFLKGVS